MRAMQKREKKREAYKVRMRVSIQLTVVMVLGHMFKNKEQNGSFIIHSPISHCVAAFEKIQLLISCKAY